MHTSGHLEQEAPGRAVRRTQSERASVACQRCHVKKIRCNATANSRCTNCISGNHDCALIESRRGKYARKRRAASPEDTCRMTSKPRSGAAALDACRGSVRRDEIDSSIQDITDDGQDWQLQAAVRSTADFGGRRLLSPAISAIGKTPSPATHMTAVSEDSPQSFYAQIAEQSIVENSTPGHDGETVFLGETFSLTYVIDHILAPFLRTNGPMQHHQRRHFPVTARQRADSTSSARPMSSAAQRSSLQRFGLDHRLPDGLRDHLLQLYFRYFHVAYPVIRRCDWKDSQHTEQQSQLVWAAMLMNAVTLCDETTLQRNGYADRQAIRAIFYKQARHLYDNDLESDPLDVVRATFLMSFWWGGPTELKDSKHWLGISMTLAQSQGLHRSTQRSNISSRKTRSWKLIWWSLKTRDVLISASIGRPQQTWQCDCDVELPTSYDLEEELGDYEGEAAHYFTAMAHLSDIITRVINSRYLCHKPTISSAEIVALEDTMTAFMRELHSSLQYTHVDAGGKGFWAAMLALAHGYGMILLCRPSTNSTTNVSTAPWGNTAKAIAAANAVTRATEDLLAASLINFAQVHSVAALFNALAVHLYVMCSSAQSITRKIAESRASMCMMGLSSLQVAWPVGGWVLKLFESVMHRVSSRSSKPGRAVGGHIRTSHSQRAVDSAISICSDTELDHSTQLDTQPAHLGSCDVNAYMPGIDGSMDRMPNLFGWGESPGQTAFDQESFFQWLELPGADAWVP